MDEDAVYQRVTRDEKCQQKAKHGDGSPYCAREPTESVVVFVRFRELSGRSGDGASPDCLE